MRDALDLLLPRHRQPVERLLLAHAAQPLAAGHGDDASPLRRERQAGEERAAVVEPGVPAALDDESAAGEGPGADRRAPRAADGLRQRRRIGVEAVQLRQRARHRQRELRARAETGVRRQRAVHADARALPDVVVVEKPPGERRGALRRPRRAH